MSSLKPLNWVDTTKGIDRVYCEKTDTYIEGAVLFCSTLVADYVIRKNRYSSGFTINYGGRTEPEYDTLEEAEHWCEFTHYASKMQPYVRNDSIAEIRNWFRAAKPEPTSADICTQIGCHFEEVAEMSDAIACRYESDEMAEVFKSAGNNDAAKDYVSDINHIELLDAICDQIVTATGVAYMMGFDIEGALKEVIRSNNSKMVNGKFEFNENGKIMKPKGYSKPDLTPFINESDGER